MPITTAGPGRLRTPAGIGPDGRTLPRRPTTATMASPASAHGASGAPGATTSTTPTTLRRERPHPSQHPHPSAVLPELHHVAVGIFQVHRRAVALSTEALPRLPQ